MERKIVVYRQAGAFAVGLVQQGGQLMPLSMVGLRPTAAAAARAGFLALVSRADQVPPERAVFGAITSRARAIGWGLEYHRADAPGSQPQGEPQPRCLHTFGEAGPGSRCQLARDHEGMHNNARGFAWNNGDDGDRLLPDGVADDDEGGSTAPASPQPQPQQARAAAGPLPSLAAQRAGALASVNLVADRAKALPALRGVATSSKLAPATADALSAEAVRALKTGQLVQAVHAGALTLATAQASMAARGLNAELVAEWTADNFGAHKAGRAGERK